MTSTAITPEIENVEILEDSPMTEAEEKELVIVKTAITTAYADKLERDLAIGAGLLKIFRRKLYRGKEGGRSWKEWLHDESAELTAGQGRIEEKTSQYLRGFYQFRVEVLQRWSRGSTDLPLPTSPKQVRPLLGQLDSHPQAAIAMWKAACTSAGKGIVPNYDQVQRAYHVHISNEQNEARRLSAAQQERMEKANAARTANVPSAGSSAFIPSREEIMEMANHEAHEAGEPKPFTPQDFSPATPQPTVPAWELEKHDDSVDAGAECKRITQALNSAFKAVAELRGILYTQTNKYGSDYLNFLRQVDAGVYSLNNIDDQIEQLSDDIDFVAELLTVEVGEGELARSTIDVNAVPSR